MNGDVETLDWFSLIQTKPIFKTKDALECHYAFLTSSTNNIQAVNKFVKNHRYNNKTVVDMCWGKGVDKGCSSCVEQRNSYYKVTLCEVK